MSFAHWVINSDYFEIQKKSRLILTGFSFEFFKLICSDYKQINFSLYHFIAKSFFFKFLYPKLAH
jgi:hypothetical protein